jgi:hypothetical protein
LPLIFTPIRLSITLLSQRWPDAIISRHAAAAIAIDRLPFSPMMLADYWHIVLVFRFRRFFSLAGSPPSRVVDFTSRRQPRRHYHRLPISFFL